MTMKDLPSPELLRKLLRYEPDTGKLFWEQRTVEMFETEKAFNSWNARFAGREAFTAKDNRGYNRGSILGKHYRSHRVAWCIHYGSWPDGEIDHINGNKSDNRISNIRDVDRSHNMRNIPMRANNTSGYNGVSFCNTTKRWVAYIGIGSRMKVIGHFLEKDEAITARRKAEIGKGYTKRHGFASPLDAC